VREPLDTFVKFVFITAVVLVFGALGTAAIIAPLGALVGYGYEWYLERQ